MLLLVHKILKFYINGMLNCKCPAPGSKGYYALNKFLMSFQSVVAFIKEIINNDDNVTNDIYDSDNNSNST
jgi:hypothetical protein